MGPIGDLIGGHAGAYEQSVDVDPKSIPAAAGITGAGALGAGAGATVPELLAGAKTAAPYIDKLLGSHTMARAVAKFEAYKWGAEWLLKAAFGRDKK